MSRQKSAQTQSQQHSSEASDGDSWAKAGGFARCRHHLWGRRFTRRQSGRQWITAGQSGGYAENRRGTGRGLGLETAEDDALNDWVEIFDHRRRPAQSSIAARARVFGRVFGEGVLAGED